MKPTMTCNICSKVRGLSEHLTELGLAADYLGNTSTYISEHGTATIRTETIGDWVRIAAQLKTVEVDAWKFNGDDATYCSTIADNIDAHSKHYTAHATALTRFMFVCNGLEEAYRFIDHLYTSFADRMGIEKRQRKRTSSLRAAELLDDLFKTSGLTIQPQNFAHLCGVFTQLFDEYKKEHSAALSGIELGADQKQTYALHLVRNLRNHVAHGTFPIGPPADYGGYEDSEELIQLLNHACRVSALYIQVIFRGYSPGFNSHEFNAMLHANGEEFDRFLKNCNLEYIKNLHLKNSFALHHNLYHEYDDDESEH
ncbi:hypothetical protein [Undibacterium sp. Xuan67W]|uniref:hypothetical protein n=1 Tax=Undibacterium sp. Xuan67W TaxID=3413057 RepID=UPI003BF1600C